MRSTFFSLPRELRDTVYHHYIFEPDGYHFNVESGKFRASGNRPIDLALSLASKSVAAEMHHLALERNVLNFWTSDFRRQEAGRFNALFEQMLDDKSWLLRTLQDPQFGRYKTSEVDKKVAQEYPQLEPLLLDLNNGSWGASIYRASNGGVAESCTRGFLDYLVEVLSRDTNFIKAWGDAYGNDASSYEKRIVPFAKSTLFLSSPEPWAMPSRYELAKMSEVISPRSILERRKWRFSAAAVAINFLNSIPQTTLMKIRKIVLHENRRSVGRPECHGLGLIPFCSQNPKLHMERRVSLWRNIVGRDIDRDFVFFNDLDGDGVVRLDAGDEDLFDRDATDKIGDHCCNWIAEAYALTANAMPANSFTLVLDGDPAPDQSAELFER